MYSGGTAILLQHESPHIRGCGVVRKFTLSMTRPLHLDFLGFITLKVIDLTLHTQTTADLSMPPLVHSEACTDRQRTLGIDQHQLV